MTPEAMKWVEPSIQVGESVCEREGSRLTGTCGLVRAPCRHNFSMYFYEIYLTLAGGLQGGSSTNSSSLGSGGGLPEALASQLPHSLEWVAALGARLADPRALAFAPQLAILGVLCWTLHEELPLCWLLQTIGFVALNKVGGNEHVALRRQPCISAY